MFDFQNVTIDVCSLEHDIALLQQACDITDGVFFKVPNLAALLQYLLVIEIFILQLNNQS